MPNAYASDLNSNTRTTVIAVLNARLADAIDLKLAVKQAHWNIRGPNFIALHELFDEIAARMEEHADTMAERVVQLGGVAGGTTQVVSQKTALSPYPAEATRQEDHVKALSDRLTQFAKACREAIETTDSAGDADSADIMTGVSRAIDKDLWFVAAHQR